MEDVALTRLFERMDRHLAQQDAHLARQNVNQQAVLATLAEQNKVLAEMAQMLAQTWREMEANAREALAFWAAEREAWGAILREIRRGQDARER